METLIRATKILFKSPHISCGQWLPDTDKLFGSIDGNSILLSMEKQEDSKYEFPVRKYGTTKHIIHIRPAVKEIYSEFDKSHPFFCTIFEVKSGVYRIAPQKPSERRFMRKPKTAFNGMVRRYRMLYLTKSQRDLLGVPTCAQYLTVPFPLKVTVDLTNKVEMRVSPVVTQADAELPMFRELLDAIGKDNFYRHPRTFLIHYYGYINLPAEFVRRGNVGMTDQLIVREEGRTLVIEGHPFRCEFCGQVIYASQARAKNTHVCCNCGHVLPDVAETIKANGGVEAGLKDAQKRLEAAYSMVHKAGRRMKRA